MYGKYERLGYYGVLGLQDTATSAEIKKGYYRAAKEFHPEVHFHQLDDSTKNKLNAIFSYINDAYATLSDPARRTEYDRKSYIKPYRKHRNR